MTGPDDDGPCRRTLRLAYTRPFDWPAMLAFFRGRAVTGLEEVDGGRYRRTIVQDGHTGLLTVRDDAGAGVLLVDVEAEAQLPLAAVTARLRRNLDLDADLDAVARHLGQDPVLAGLMAQRPAVRIPGHWDPFEAAVRAVLGQQVSLAAACVLAGRLLDRASPRRVAWADGGPDRLFPTPAEVLAADLTAMGMPGARVDTLRSVASAALADPDLFRRGPTLDDTIARLRAIKGVGPWTAHYIALRACREPDAFPASDVGLLRGFAREGRRPNPAELDRRAEAWRPFRAYAAHHIWAADPVSLPVYPAGRGIARQ